MNVTAAIVTYNRKALLEECLQALYALKEPVDIVVINNASTDGTYEYLEEQKKAHPIVCLHSKQNLGGAGGFNLAMKEAMKNQPDFVWLMDDDTIVNPDSLRPLLEAAKRHPRGAFFSSRALWTDGSENVMNDHRLLAKPLKQGEILCREATFVSLLVSAWAIEQKGLPIKEFFIWGDDIEYTRRLSFAFEGYYVPQSVVLHKTAGNTGSNIALDDISRLSRYRYAYRNEVYIARKEGWKRQIRQLAKILFHTGRVVLVSREAKIKKIALIWSASWQGLSFNPAAESLETEKETKVL